MIFERNVLMDSNGHIYTVSYKYHRQIKKAEFNQSFRKKGEDHYSMLYTDLLDYIGFVIDSRDVPDYRPEDPKKIRLKATYYPNKDLRKWMKDSGFRDEWLAASRSVYYVLGDNINKKHQN